ncbi:unnamed protein product [Ilex paraguariensis]|uniref:BHLH domain-containing protein n=1 Tax=Ilex paraguariensis TaxID=185542 RepID=A0ABC8UH49_9AQUA
MNPGDSSSRPRRNQMERERRIRMRALVSQLASLIPNTEETLSLPALLDEATSHVKRLKHHLEELRKRREQLQVQGDDTAMEGPSGGLTLPVLAITDMGSVLEVNLITGANKSCMFYEIFSVLQEEGAQVVSASCSTVGARIFYSIYSKALYARIGICTSRITERLQNLVHHFA